MRKLEYPSTKDWQDLIKRPTQNFEELESGIAQTFQRVKEGGDSALLELTEKYDRAQLSSLLTSADEIASAAAELSDELKGAIQQAYNNIKLFHAQQAEQSDKVETMPGVTC